MLVSPERAEAIAWKKGSLAKIGQARTLLREFRANLNKMCDGVRAVVRDAGRDAERIARVYDRGLNEESEDYDRDADAMAALNDFPGIDEEVEDAKLQAGDSLDGLLTQLDEVLSAVKAVKP